MVAASSFLVGNFVRTQTLSDLEKLMSPEKSFRNYRDRLTHINPPAIPYMGVTLSDLTFLDEGNSDMTDGLINFSKRMLNYTVITESVQTYQDAPYDNFKVLPDLLRLLMTITPLSDKAIYELSLKREPRE